MTSAQARIETVTMNQSSAREAVSTNTEPPSRTTASARPYHFAGTDTKVLPRCRPFPRRVVPVIIRLAPSAEAPARPILFAETRLCATTKSSASLPALSAMLPATPFVRPPAAPSIAETMLKEIPGSPPSLPAPPANPEALSIVGPPAVHLFAAAKRRSISNTETPPPAPPTVGAPITAEKASAGPHFAAASGRVFSMIGMRLLPAPAIPPAVAIPSLPVPVTYSVEATIRASTRRSPTRTSRSVAPIDRPSSPTSRRPKKRRSPSGACRRLHFFSSASDVAMPDEPSLGRRGAGHDADVPQTDIAGTAKTCCGHHAVVTRKENAAAAGGRGHHVGDTQSMAASPANPFAICQNSADTQRTCADRNPGDRSRSDTRTPAVSGPHSPMPYRYRQPSKRRIGNAVAAIERAMPNTQLPRPHSIPYRPIPARQPRRKRRHGYPGGARESATTMQEQPLPYCFHNQRRTTKCQ